MAAGIFPEEQVARVYDALRAGRPDDAGAFADALVRAFPQRAEAWRAMAAVLQRKGEAVPAVDAMRRAIECAPMSAPLRLEMAQLAVACGRPEVALEALEHAVKLDPTFAAAWLALGAEHYRQGHDLPARDAFARAHALAPRDSQVIRALAEAEFALEHFDRARLLFLGLLEGQPDDDALVLRVARCESRTGRPEDARARYLERLRTRQSAAFWLGLGQAEEDLGKRADAANCYEAALRLEPGSAEVMASLLMLQKGDAPDSLVRDAEVVAGTTTPPSYPRAFLHYALGKRADACADYAAAMAHWHAANHLRRQLDGSFDRGQLDRICESAIATFTPELFERLRGAGSPDSRPVFIVGMPRSGTTLVEQVLASHPSVHGGGELTEIVRIETLARELKRPVEASDVAAWSRAYLEVAASGAPGKALRLVDKQPYNFMHLGLIALLFPNARVVWCRRDPRDIAVSIYSENFAPAATFATSLEDIVYMARAQEVLMRHWRNSLPLPVHEVVYESLTAQFEQRARELVDFVGLPWSEDCLRFHDNTRAVQTFSRWQVRQPVHSRSVGRWRHYMQWLPESLLNDVPPG